MTVSNAPRPLLVLMIHSEADTGYRDYLRTAGFRVEEAQSGPHGFERASALRPDLIVLDFGLNGETTARLRRDPTTSHVPIIALTALSSLHVGRAGAAATSASAGNGWVRHPYPSTRIACNCEQSRQSTRC